MRTLTGDITWTRSPGNDIWSPLSDVRAHRLSNDPTYLQTSFSAIVSSPHSDNSIKYAKEIKTALNSKLYKEYHDGCVSPHPCRPHGLIPLLFPCVLPNHNFHQHHHHRQCNTTYFNRCLQRPDLDNNQSCCHPMDFHTQAHPTSLLSSILSILPFIIIIIKIATIISATCCYHQYCSKVVTSTFFLGSTQCWSKKKGKWVAYFEKSLPVTS